MGVYLVNFLVYSMAMVGLLFVCLVVYKKTMLNNKCAKNNEELKVENALNLSQRKTLYVVKAGNEKFLIAADVERTSFLAKLDTDEQIQTAQIRSAVPEIKTFELEKTTAVRNAQKPNKPVDYSEVMAAIKSSNAIKQKQPVMKEMLKKLSEPIQKDK